MQLLRDDEHQLQRALELAQNAAAFASPNPAVGCVITCGAQVIGEGAHRYDLRDHAEVAALKSAAAQGHNVNGATAYVTLEPCSHHGRTGPCADALIAAGVARCVVATVDPNPLVRGQGLGKLKAAGVAVVLAEPASPVAQTARRLNDAFAFSIQHDRPFVTLKAAISQDGKLAPTPDHRAGKTPFWLTGPAARRDVQQLRHRSDALLTGIGTVLADDPELTDRTGLPRRQPLLRIVLDSDLRTPPDAKLLQTARGDVLLFAAKTASMARERALKEAGAEVIRIPGAAGGLDFGYLWATLAAVPVRSLLVEAGSALNGSLLAQDLVDRVVLYEAPVELGPEAMPFAPGQSTLHDLKKRLTTPTHESFARGEGQDLKLSGYLHDPWFGI